MTTSLTTLRNGLCSTLAACGPYTAGQISTCDYGVIERSSGCAIILTFQDENDDPLTYSTGTTNTEMRNISIMGECYIAFTGDSQKFLSDVWQARDDIKSTFAKDNKLQSSACYAWVSKVSFNSEEGYELGGKDYGVVRFIVNVQDL